MIQRLQSWAAWLAAVGLGAAGLLSGATPLATATTGAPVAAIPAGPVPVQVVEAHGQFVLLRGGQPYTIRGAGGSQNLAGLAAIGGNSVRTWGDVTRAFLDEAHAHGLTVCVGLWVEHERHHFDYGDAAAVQAQIERLQRQIDTLKDHPAVLLWGIGNEVEIGYTDRRVWDVIEAVAAYAKRVDPHHPTMTVTAHLNPEATAQIRQRAPSIDILGINSYGGVSALPAAVRQHWPGPYIITEWGADGRWEVKKTAWGAELEQSSTEKASDRARRYGIIAGDRERNLGSYAFLWGHKIEGTLTWFNVFTEDGAATEEVEVLSYLWRHAYPENRAPRLGQLLLNGHHPRESLRVAASAPLVADYQLLSPTAEVARVRWVVYRESDDKRLGGDTERRPGRFELPIAQPAVTRAELLAPSESGPYRLYLYVYGAGGKTVATANFPFWVEGPAAPASP